MSEPLRRSRENTRARLIEAAVELFVEKGQSSVRIDDVVAAAGFTRGAFYSNFESLDELFVAAVHALSEQSLEYARSIIAQETDLRGEGVLSRVLERLRPHGREMFLLSTEFTMFALRHPEVAPKALEMRQRLTAEFVVLLSEIFDRMDLRPQADLDFIADSLIVLFYDSVVKENLGTDSAQSQQLLESAISSLIFGLAEPPKPAL